MHAVTVIVSIVLALVLTASAVSKLRRAPQVVQSLGAAGVPDDWFAGLATLELLGAAGLVLGFAWTPLGVAAAIGVVLYFLGAVGAHVRVQDWKGLPAAAVLLVVAVATLLLRLADR